MQVESKFESERTPEDSCAKMRLALWARLLRAVKCETATGDKNAKS